MKKIYLYLISFVIGFTACDSFLTEDPKEFVSPDSFFNTEDEVESALLGCYAHLQHEQIGDFGWLFRGEGGADVAVMRNILRYNVYQYYLMESQPTQVLNSWRIHYKAVGDANMVINRTSKSGFSDEFKKQVIAEASFIRAYVYFQLTLMWGDLPLWTEEITGENLNEISSLSRSSQQDVYNQIIKDLQFASEILPDTRESSKEGRITKWAAKALLSKVYLFAQKWENASLLAQEVIKSPYHQLSADYTSIFDTESAGNSERLFVIPYLADVKGQGLHTVAAPDLTYEPITHDYTESAIIRPDGKEVMSNADLIQGWGVYYLASEFVESFDSADKRKWGTAWHYSLTTDGDTIYFKDKKEGTAYYNLKWISFDDKEFNGSKDIIHMRLAEVYLILAEAENELHNGPTTVAYEAINALRRRAFGSNEHDIPAGLSKDAFKRAIIDENRWELGGEGVRAWYLRHWGFDELKKAVESIAGSNDVAPQNLQPHHMFYKIPEEEIIKNPNLIQNNGY